jgi:rubrerythrin
MNDFGLEIDNTRIEELLKPAIVSASEAEAFYAELVKNAAPPERGETLGKILRLKTKHKATLEGLYVMVTLEKPERLPEKGLVSYTEIKPEGEIQGYLGEVIGLEEKVCRYYQELSKRTDDQQLRHLLRMLAEEQQSMVDLLWELTVSGPSPGVVKHRLL